MNYGILIARDNRKSNYVLYAEGPNESRPYRLKDEYMAFRCPACLKINAEKAVRQIPPTDAVLECRRDYFELDEGLAGVSSRFAQFVAKNGIGGVEFISISKSRYAIMLPSQRVRLEKTEGIKLFDKCGTCGQHKESAGFPKVPDEKVPHHSIFLTDVALAGRRAESFIFYASLDICDALTGARFSGLMIDQRLHKSRTEA